MNKIIVNSTKCPQDHRCPAIKVCPVNAIKQENINALPEVDKELCILCKKCIMYCPKKAFEILN